MKLTESNLLDLQYGNKLVDHESSNLKNMIWELFNYCNTYLVLLDRNMNVKLANLSLASDLGFEAETDLIGKNWLDFIPEENKSFIQHTYHNITLFPFKENHKELINEIKTIDNKIITVKWINNYINSKFNMVLSTGIKTDLIEKHMKSEDTMRSFYMDIIKRDRNMIEALRETV